MDTDRKLLNSSDVEAVIQTLSADLPKGAERYDALMIALEGKYGRRYDFTPEGLRQVEDWSGIGARGGAPVDSVLATAPRKRG